VLAVTDAVELARAADAVLLVARGAATPYDVAQRAQATFSSSRILGFVLNDVKHVPRRGYYYYYHSYGGGRGRRPGKAAKGSRKKGMIRLLNVTIRPGPCCCCFVEALLVSGSFLLATAYLLGPDR